MAARLEAALLPSAQGHSIVGTRPPALEADMLAPFRARVLAAIRATRKTGREHGFLAYLGRDGSLHAEEDSVGDAHDITWHWEERDATVAFSFHTHPTTASREPSGIDLVGALVRGDHVVYIATPDGRIDGWRFRKDGPHARAVHDAMSTLERANGFRTPFLGFLYAAFEELRPQLVELAYTEAGAAEPVAPTQFVNARSQTRKNS